MIMTNGIGASIGTWIAGTYVINKNVDMAPGADAATNLIGWQQSWGIFAIYALVITILFILIFKRPKNDKLKISSDRAAELAGGDPEGMVDIMEQK